MNMLDSEPMKIKRFRDVIEKVFDGALRESTNPISRWTTKKYK